MMKSRFTPTTAAMDRKKTLAWKFAFFDGRLNVIALLDDAPLIVR